MSEPKAHVVNLNEVEETPYEGGGYWRSYNKRLTPPGAALGVNLARVPPGHTSCPYHYHQLEHEAFLVMSGRGMLRYGEELRMLKQGDCVYCPAGTGVAHQLANPFDEDFVYLAMGPRDPHEVCVYPDNGKVMVRSLQTVGFLSRAPYLEGEPEKPTIFDLAKPLAASPTEG